MKYLRLILCACALCLVTCDILCFAFNIDAVTVNFLRGDYKAAIQEGEKILALGGHQNGLDELYYIMGLSYLKDGNYLRASDIFEIILHEFKGSAFTEEAALGLGDVYFLKADYQKAYEYYQRFTASYPQSKFLPLAWHRLSQVEFKRGNTKEAQQYIASLQQKYPANLESKLNTDFGALANIQSELLYAVQVGCFSKSENAANLCKRLSGKGYDCYIEEGLKDNEKLYRVKVGRFKSRLDAVAEEAKLLQEGYPTKILP